MSIASFSHSMRRELNFVKEITVVPSSSLGSTCSFRNAGLLPSAAALGVLHKALFPLSCSLNLSTSAQFIVITSHCHVRRGNWSSALLSPSGLVSWACDLCVCTGSHIQKDLHFVQSSAVALLVFFIILSLSLCFVSEAHDTTEHACGRTRCV